MKKIQLEIVALSHSVAQSQNYAVVLGEKNGSRRLPIVIGGFEAQAIAVAMERMVPNRPLTHDLLKNILQIYHVDLQEIIINDLHEGIFYAQLICLQNGQLKEIDSRTSDALAMAVRFECPIYTYESILERAGVVLEVAEENISEENSAESKAVSKKTTKRSKRLSAYSVSELHQMLNEVLENEDYERAAEIRDEINKREQ